MNIEEEMKINNHQPIYGIEGTDVANFYNAIIEDCKSLGWEPARCILYLMDKAYSFGLIQGKRSEQARKRRRERV